MSRDFEWEICECDNGIGESCKVCYSPEATKRCLHRWCGDCGIEGCSVRVCEKETGHGKG